MAQTLILLSAVCVLLLISQIRSARKAWRECKRIRDWYNRNCASNDAYKAAVSSSYDSVLVVIFLSGLVIFFLLTLFALK